MIPKGGPSIPQDILRRILIDDYRLPAFPAFYGRGRPRFETFSKRPTLKPVPGNSLEDGGPVLHDWQYGSREGAAFVEGG